MNFKKQFKEGLITQNPVLVQLLGMDAVEEIFRIIIPKGIGIEVNTNRGNDPLPGPSVLRLYREMGGEVITLGSDAHAKEHVGCM